MSIEKLTEIHAASGSEHNLQKVFCKNIRPFVTDVCVDTLGNAIAHKEGKGKRIMIIAHADEVSLMVTYIDERGFLYVKPTGYIDVNMLPARKVNVVHENTIISGVIGKRPIHLQDAPMVQLSYQDIWIDIGASNKEDALSMVSPGDHVYFDSCLTNIPNHIVTGKAIDNRCGVFAMLRIAEEIKDKECDWDVYFVSSVQEEIGGRGAIVATNAIKPDLAICIDSMHATDYPSMSPIKDGDIRLGYGCAIAKGPNIDDRLFKQLIECANKYNVPFQIQPIPSQAPADANWVQISNDGVRTALVSIPCRYMHTPNEMVSMKDVEAVINLGIVLLSN